MVPSIAEGIDCPAEGTIIVASPTPGGMPCVGGLNQEIFGVDIGSAQKCLAFMELKEDYVPLPATTGASMWSGSDSKNQFL